MNNFFLLVRHVNVNVVVNVHVVMAVLTVDRRHVDDFLLRHWNRNIDNLLDHLLHLPHLRDHFWHLNDLFLLVRYVDVNVVVNVHVVVAVLTVDRRYVDNLLLHHRHWNLNVMIHMDMVMPILARDDGHVNNLLLHHGHWHVNMVIHVNVVVAILARNRGHMHDLLDRHGNRHIHDLLDGSLLDTLLRNNFRDLYNLLNDLLYGYRLDLRHFLDHLTYLHFGNVLVLNNFLHGGDFHSIRMRLSCHHLLLIEVQCLRRSFDLIRLPNNMLWWRHHLSLHCRRIVNRHGCLFVNFLSNPHAFRLVCRSSLSRPWRGHYRTWRHRHWHWCWHWC